LFGELGMAAAAKLTTPVCLEQSAAAGVASSTVPGPTDEAPVVDGPALGD
jgi:hypothetical protein